MHGERTLALLFMIFYSSLMKSSILVILSLGRLLQFFEFFMIELIFPHLVRSLLKVPDE